MTARSEMSGVVTNPTKPPKGPKRFKPGDIIWQTKVAPDGWRFEVLEDRGGIIYAQPIGVGQFPVELNSLTVALAED